MKMKICPKCGKFCEKLLALSRRDNKTMICNDCSMKEAFEDFFGHYNIEEVKYESKDNGSNPA